MPAIDLLFSVQRLRKALWKFWYPFLTRRLAGAPVLFLNYAFEEDPPLGIPLSGEEEPHRGCVQLYHHVGGLAELAGKKILEVGCGHGGGASYLSRRFKPASTVGMDINPAGVEFCRERHRLEGLSFEEGDAEDLPFSDGRFDAVVNVESSHCYPDFPRFLSEVARVLKPGGRLHYADFRFKESLPAWEADLARGPLAVERRRDITREVLRGMEMNSEGSAGMVRRFLPGFLQGLGRDFAGIKGSRIHEAFRSGNAVYASYLLVKKA